MQRRPFLLTGLAGLAAAGAQWGASAVPVLADEDEDRPAVRWMPGTVNVRLAPGATRRVRVTLRADERLSNAQLWVSPALRPFVLGVQVGGGASAAAEAEETVLRVAFLSQAAATPTPTAASGSGASTPTRTPRAGATAAAGAPTPTRTPRAGDGTGTAAGPGLTSGVAGTVSARRGDRVRVTVGFAMPEDADAEDEARGVLALVDEGERLRHPLKLHVRALRVDHEDDEDDEEDKDEDEDEDDERGPSRAGAGERSRAIETPDPTRTPRTTESSSTTRSARPTQTPRPRGRGSSGSGGGDREREREKDKDDD